jgi:PAS domain S-box-containing protein
MSSEDLLEIRESLLSRADEIAVKWYNGAVNDPDKRKGAPDEIISILKQVVKGSIELLTSDAFGPSKAAELGEKTSRLKIDGKDFMGRTHEILTYEFTKELSMDHLQLIYHNLTSFTANFTTGYYGVAISDLKSQQERMHKALMHDLLIVDEKLKETNEELEAKVEKRTAELKMLNMELKAEVEMRIKAENNLIQREHLLSVVFNTTLLWTGLLDPSGRLILPNKAALDFMGLKKADVVGQFFWETPWWKHSKELQDKVQKAVYEAKKGTASQFEVYHLDPQGSKLDVLFSIRPVKNDLGEIIYLILEGVLLNDMKEAE